MAEQKLPEVIGRIFDGVTVTLDGVSYQKCTFKRCQLIYRGGPARVVSCSIGAGCVWEFQDTAAFVMQTLSDLGWKLAPLEALSPLENRR
jgi:hypothetical protein